MHETILKICREVESTIPADYNQELISSGYIDSFGTFMILASLEIEFDISIPDTELCYENFKSINNMVDMIKKIKEGNLDEKSST